MMAANFTRLICLHFLMWCQWKDLFIFQPLLILQFLRVVYFWDLTTFFAVFNTRWLWMSSDEKMIIISLSLSFPRQIIFYYPKKIEIKCVSSNM